MAIRVDIHSAQSRGRELFEKTDFQDVGPRQDGISFQRDPDKHREIARQIHPAFSMRSLRAQEPALHVHIDQFVRQVIEHGGGEKGLDIKIVSISSL